jgi:hypothetical protein
MQMSRRSIEARKAQYRKKSTMIEYAVRHNETGKIRIVEAHNHSSALRRVAGGEYTVTIPTRAEMFKFAKDGLEIEPWKQVDENQPQFQQGQDNA